MPEGRYRVTIDLLSDGLFVKSVAVGADDLLTSDLTVNGNTPKILVRLVELTDLRADDAPSDPSSLPLVMD